LNLAEFSLNNRVFILTLTFAGIGGGLLAFNGMSRLEDPEFTIKDALVITPYPGASAAEVEQEVTDALELAVQQLGQLKEIESRSDRGLSTITVTIKDQYNKTTLPQVWDELRRKVGDAQSDLPPGAGPSVVIDDYGDVFGVFVAVYGEEYSYAELKETVDLLRRELVLVNDVAKISTFGERVECIYVELSRDRLAQLGIPESAIVDELRERNEVTDSGRVIVGPDFVAIEPTGVAQSVAHFESILISRGIGKEVYLGDVATIRRGYLEPPSSLIRYDGALAIGFGISTVPGGNVVTMGKALEQRMLELRPQVPLGIDFGIVSLQSDAVAKAINGFTVSLLQAVAIVIVVLLLFMGLRSGLLIGFILLLTIVSSFVFLQPWGVALERISLGALIIALGMLVDNAIVVVDGILIRLQRGEEAGPAAIAVVQQSSIPLLGATVIAVLAFAAIGTSDDKTGEFCRSLFQVVLVSLLLSWVTAVTVTPVLCAMFLPSRGTGNEPDEGPVDTDPYAGGFYRLYGTFLAACIRLRWVSIGTVVGVFTLAIYGFGFLDQSFFPSSTRPQFLVDFWLPKGSDIIYTGAETEKVEQYLLEREGVTHVTSLVGKGGLRFLLTYTPEQANTGYTQFLVDVDSSDRIDGLIAEIETDLAENFSHAISYAFRFELGPGANGKVRARFSGTDRNELRRLADEALAIMEQDPDAKAIHTDWWNRVKVLEPVIANEPANLNGIQRRDVSHVLRQGFQGLPVGVYREKDLLLPIVMRAQPDERTSVDSIRNLQIWSPSAGAMIPLRQVVHDFETRFEDELIIRRDRKPTITVFSDPISGPASALFGRVRPKIEAIALPDDYSLEWGGEYEDSGDARAAMAGSIPLFVLIMLIVTIGLFNSLKQPAIIWLCVPLAVIGVTAGLLATGQPFGFMALLGFLSLMGMLIKNAIVLIDEINLQRSEGKVLLPAIIDSATSRLRPVSMAASTTALGMIPLLADDFFRAMAVTIIGGLIFATLLTMVVVPVLFSIFYAAEADVAATGAEIAPHSLG
jgi:multidrug efflux pump subunit AcrB